MNMNGTMVLPPTALRTTGGEITTDPEEIKAETWRFYHHLYSKPSKPVCAKPWMETKSVLEVKERCTYDPYRWPREMTLQDLDQILCTGNQAPSPGPDGWEKWIVRLLPEKLWRLVCTLANFTIH